MRRAEKAGRFRRPIMIGWLSATVGYAVYLFGAQFELLLYVSGAAFFLGYSIYQPMLPTFYRASAPPDEARRAASITLSASSARPSVACWAAP